jgi:hypothetical protein
MNVNDLQSELSAMHHIGEALSRLDEPTRARVLRWIHERFESAAAAAPAAPSAAPSQPPALRIVASAPRDEALSVSWDEMFDDDPAESVASAAPAPQSVAVLLHEFVAEFQGIAREWGEACATPAETVSPAPALSVAS